MNKKTQNSKLKCQNHNLKFKIIFLFQCFLLILLSIYSYTQIDLNLTLSSLPIYQNLQKQLIQLGYFNRPLSTLIYIILIFSVFSFQFSVFSLVKTKEISKRQIWWLIGLSVVILLFSYPAFSHDIFNYLFDARIVTLYGKNPWLYKALDFPFDLWTRFMHWTHRYYPYGPTWLLISLLPSSLSRGIFTLTLLNFKILMALFHLGTIYLIGRIMKMINGKKAALAVIFFAFNPLILLENLVSAHHNVVELFFLLWSFYLLIRRDNFLAMSAILVSAGIRYTTVLYLPLVAWWIYLNRQKVDIDYQTQARIWVFISYLALILTLLVGQRQLQPWYYLLTVGLTSLVIDGKILTRLTIIFSLILLWRYVPFLYLGEYTNLEKTSKYWLTLIPLFGWGLYELLWRKKSIVFQK